MPSIIIDIPSGADLTRAVNAIAIRFAYEPLIGDPPVTNPETKNQFAKRQVALMVKEIIRSVECAAAADTARAQAEISANSIVIT